MAQMFRRLMEKDLEAFAGEYKRLLRTLPSYYDLKEENSYHMMMLGMCTFLTGDYDVESNRESGKGRSDIILKAKTGEKPNIVMEFKGEAEYRHGIQVYTGREERSAGTGGRGAGADRAEGLCGGTAGRSSVHWSGT